MPQIDALEPSLPPTLSMSSGNPEFDEQIHYYRHFLGTLAFTPTNPMAERNPLRLMLPLISGTEALQNAIVLLAAVHRRRPLLERMSLKNKALKVFRATIDSIDDIKKLATILILILCDSVENGFGAWRVHLVAVRSILNAVLGNSNRRTLLQSELLRGLVIRFYMWDTIHCLTSMQESVLPAEYLKDAIFVDREETGSECTSTMFEDVGCSGKLFWTLNQVAHGSIRSVNEVLQTPPTAPEIFVQQGYSNEEALERVRTEHIWKFGIVAYLSTRVAPYVAARHQFTSFARVVVGHAARLAPKSCVRRKMLFPLLVAGSCTGDTEVRRFMTEYCISCYEESRFGFFQRGLQVLQKFWSLLDEEPRDKKATFGAAYFYWWNVAATDDSSHFMSC